MKKLLIVLMIASFGILSSQAQSKWIYTEFAELYDGDNLFYTLEYGVKSSAYDGYLKWRITNHTGVAIYNVSIMDKEYTLSDGRKVSISSKKITTKLGGYEIKTTTVDVVNPDEYGGFGDKNPATIKTLTIERPVIMFSVSESSFRLYGWGDDIGSIRVK